MTKETKKKINSFLLITLAVLTVFVSFFAPVKQVFAAASCLYSDDTSIEIPKQKIQEKLEAARQIINRDVEIKKRLAEITTTNTVLSGGYMGAPATGTEIPAATKGDEAEFDNLNKELSTNASNLEIFEKRYN